MTQKEICGYPMIRLLGEGGMAKVYLVRKGSRHYALKVLTLNSKRFETLLKRFHKEAGLISMMRHPNIIRVYEHGPGEGTYYLLIEYIEGYDLRSVVDRKQKRGIDPARATDYIYQIARALAYAHSMGVVHRDIKPGNILIESASNRAVLTDFGVAKMLENDWDLTATGMSVGTPNYMSPEQALGEPLDGRTDIYATGVMFFELLSGELPYETVKSARQMQARLRQQPTRLPPALARYQYLIDNMIAPDRESRFTNAQALLDALEHYIAPERLQMLDRLGTMEQKAIDELLIASPPPPSVPQEQPEFSQNDHSEPPPSDTGQETLSRPTLKPWQYCLALGLLILMPLIVYWLYSLRPHPASYLGVRPHSDTAKAQLEEAHALYLAGRAFPPSEPSAFSVLQKKNDKRVDELDRLRYLWALMQQSLDKGAKEGRYDPTDPQSVISLLSLLKPFVSDRLWRREVKFRLKEGLLKASSDKAAVSVAEGFESRLGPLDANLNQALKNELETLAWRLESRATADAVNREFEKGEQKLLLSRALWHFEGQEAQAQRLDRVIARYEREVPEERAGRLVAGEFVFQPGNCRGASTSGHCLKPFYVQRAEETWQALESFIEEHSAILEALKDRAPLVSRFPNLPATGLTYDEVQDFIRWLNQKGVGRFSLPTEAQWEAFAQGAKREKSQSICKDCNENFVPLSLSSAENAGESGPDALLGLYGNAWEMTCSPPTPSVSDACLSNEDHFLIKGGAFSSSKKWLHQGARFSFSRYDRSDDLGFRLVWLP